MADRNLRLQVILEGLDRVTAPLKAITGASSAARRDIGKTNEELKELGALQKQIGSYKATDLRIASDTKSLQDTQTHLASLREQLDAVEKPTKKLRAEFERTEKQAATLTARIDKGGSELQDLSAKLSAAGIDVGNLARHEASLAERTDVANRALARQTEQLERVAQAQRNSEKLNEMSSKATGVGLGMIAAGTATAAPIVMVTKQAMTLESAMADVSKVTNMAGSDIARMSDDFLDLSEKIPMSAAELASIAAAAGAAGVGMDKFGKALPDQRQQLLAFTNDAAEMGVAFDMSADQAGETMAKWRTAFELPQDGVRALGDRVNALTNSFGGKAANVTEIITRIGPLGKVAGLAAPQIAALGSTLDSIGVAPEIAATGIKNMMQALGAGESATKSQANAFKTLGLDAVTMAKRMQKDASGAITDVMERIGKLDDYKRQSILTELFGSESVGAIAPMLTNLDGLKQRLELVGDASATAGSMHAEFLNRIATTEGATGLAGNAIKALNIKLGQGLLPTVVDLSKKVAEAAGSVRAWAQDNPKLTKALMIFMAVGAGLLILLGGLALVFAAVTAAAAPLAAILTISVGALLGWMAAVVAAVAAVAAAAYLIYENWDSVGGIFDPLIDSGKALFNSMAGVVSQVGNLLMVLWNGPLGERLRIVMNLVMQLASIFGTAIGGTVMTVLNTLMQVASAVFDFIGNAIRLVAALLTGDFSGAWTAIVGMFTAGANAVVAILKGLGSIFTTIGTALMQGLVAGIRAGWEMVKATIGDVANMLPDWTRKLLGIHSPSRVFAEIGGHVISGLDQGLAANTSAPISRISDLSGQMTRALAVGAGSATIAATMPAAAQAPSSAAAAGISAGSASYTININAGGGAQSQDIADQVRKAIEQIERERRGRGFGDD
jgi:TP901 family phage tail tape measure protein